MFPGEDEDREGGLDAALDAAQREAAQREAYARRVYQALLDLPDGPEAVAMLQFEIYQAWQPYLNELARRKAEQTLRFYELAQGLETSPDSHKERIAAIARALDLPRIDIGGL